MFAIVALDIGSLAIAAVIFLAVVALVFIACRAFGLAIPGWVVQVIGVCLAALVIIAAIRFVMSL